MTAAALDADPVADAPKPTMAELHAKAPQLARHLWTTTTDFLRLWNGPVSRVHGSQLKSLRVPRSK